MATPFRRDFLCGGAAGAAAGIVVAPVEYLKVVSQTTPSFQLRRTLSSSQTYHNMFRAIPSFSAVFACVCALEFSVNERIKNHYGKWYGITASALTGASFLTAADHLMFRRHKSETTFSALQDLFKIRRNALWTGFTPMVFREAIFISSVMYLGPWLGRKLQGTSKDSNSLLWISMGRVITGVITTLFSQPFDVVARQMQIHLYEKHGKQFSLFSFLKGAQEEFRKKIKNNSAISHPLLRGAVPRMGLATVGGVLAGGFFDIFHQKVERMILGSKY